jgi:XapX domain-containing protein
MQMPAESASAPVWVGLLVALAIGALVRFLKLPIPSPPTIWGALMVLALTLGYLAADYFIRR